MLQPPLEPTSSRPGIAAAGWGMDYAWFCKDSMGALNNQTATNYLASKGINVNQAPQDVITEAVNGARAQAAARGGKNPRIVDIGVMVGTHDGKRYFNGRSFWYDMTAQHWIDNWHRNVDGHEYVASSGLKYTTSQRWTSNGQSINDVAENMMHSLPNPGETQLMIIALNEGSLRCRIMLRCRRPHTRATCTCAITSKCMTLFTRE